MQPAIPLDKERIVTEAMRLIEARGAQAFSMRSLASYLGVFPTALAWHVGNRTKLMAEIGARWTREIVMPDVTGDWQDWVRQMAGRYRAAAHRSPNLARLTMGELVNHGAGFDLPEALVKALAAAGLPDDEIVPAYNALTGAVVGLVALELARLRQDPEVAVQETERESPSLDDSFDYLVDLLLTGIRHRGGQVLNALDGPASPRVLP